MSEFPIFILEDDPSFQKVLEIRLKAWKKEVKFHSAPSITAAKELLSAPPCKFELAILDQQLPDGMGWELFNHPTLSSTVILAVSADTSPELPGQTIKAGAQHFLAKRQVTEPLFTPLLDALLERRKLQEQLLEMQLKEKQIGTIKKLLATLRHEINNPLGAVLGGAYILKMKGTLDAEQTRALELIEESGTRIKHVLQQLCHTADLETVKKADEDLFHVPGDPEWK